MANYARSIQSCVSNHSCNCVVMFPIAMVAYSDSGNCTLHLLIIRPNCSKNSTTNYLVFRNTTQRARKEGQLGLVKKGNGIQVDVNPLPLAEISMVSTSRCLLEGDTTQNKGDCLVKGK